MKELDCIREDLKNMFEVKFQAMLGEGDTDDKGVWILNNILEWRYGTGILYEADQIHGNPVVRGWAW